MSLYPLYRNSTIFSTEDIQDIKILFSQQKFFQRSFSIQKVFLKEPSRGVSRVEIIVKIIFRRRPSKGAFSTGNFYLFKRYGGGLLEDPIKFFFFSTEVLRNVFISLNPLYKHVCFYILYTETPTFFSTEDIQDIKILISQQKFFQWSFFVEMIFLTIFRIKKTNKMFFYLQKTFKRTLFYKTHQKVFSLKNTIKTLSVIEKAFHLQKTFESFLPIHAVSLFSQKNYLRCSFTKRPIKITSLYKSNRPSCPKTGTYFFKYQVLVRP